MLTGYKMLNADWCAGRRREGGIRCRIRQWGVSGGGLKAGIEGGR